MEKKEFKVGEVFQCGLIKLKCVHAKKEGCCDSCYFKYRQCSDDIVGLCSSYSRKDKTDVIFIKVED